ncbi:MAG: helix-turn-helix domain-containing protein [Deltaproteobacteria bacterium]|nr:helix-turn-helix domain-containing protein [Deltaproteobacteria bacterium]
MAAKKKAAAQPDPEALQRAFVERVGEAIRAARWVREWTQAELAAEAGLSPNYVARLERGELGPSLWVAHRLAQALGIGLDALLVNAKSAPPLARTKFAKSRAARYEL